MFIAEIKFIILDVIQLNYTDRKMFLKKYRKPNASKPNESHRGYEGGTEF